MACSRIERRPLGSAHPSLAKTGFGTAWFDYDNDSWLDLITLNGSVSMIEAQARAKDPFPLKMLNQLYRNLGNGRFEDVSARGGEPFKLLDVSRGRRSATSTTTATRTSSSARRAAQLACSSTTSATRTTGSAFD